jgi:hypothetical protein
MPLSDPESLADWWVPSKRERDLEALEAAHDALREAKREASSPNPISAPEPGGGDIAVEAADPPPSPVLFPRQGASSGRDVSERENPWSEKALAVRRAAAQQLGRAVERADPEGARGDPRALVAQLAAQRRLGEAPAAQAAQSRALPDEAPLPHGREGAAALEGRRMMATAEELREHAARCLAKGQPTAADRLLAEAADLERRGLAAFSGAPSRRSPTERKRAVVRCGDAEVALTASGDVVRSASGEPRARVHECGHRLCVHCARRRAGRQRKQIADAIVAAQRESATLPDETEVPEALEVLAALPERGRKRLAALRALPQGAAVALLEHAERARGRASAAWRRRQEARSGYGYTSDDAEALEALRRADVLCAEARIAAARQGVVRTRDLAFVTLTQPALAGERLTDALERMTSTLRVLTRSAAWRDRVAGGVLRLEVVRGGTPQGAHWHVHAHALLATGWWSQAELASTWQGAQRRLGVEVSGEWAQWIERPRRGTIGALTETVKYVLKPLDVVGMDPDDVKELVEALRGKRLLRTFGALRGLELSEEDAEAMREEGEDTALERRGWLGYDAAGAPVRADAVVWSRAATVLEERRKLLEELWTVRQQLGDPEADLEEWAAESLRASAEGNCDVWS